MGKDNTAYIQSLDITREMLSMQDFLKRAVPNYDEIIQKVIEVVRNRREVTGKDTLPAVIELMEEAEAKGKTDTHVPWFAAAACELIQTEERNVRIKEIIQAVTGCKA